MAIHRWEQRVPMAIGDGVAVETMALPIGKPQATLLPGTVQMSGDVNLITQAIAGSSIPMVTGMELGELEPADPTKPSVILRKPNGESLWELAKSCGSSIDIIREANKLQADPEDTQMLLIPVL